MEMLEMTQGSTSIYVQIGGDSTDITFIIVHHSLRVRVNYEHVLAMADAVCQRASVRCCTVSPLTTTPICKMTIIVQLGIHCMKSICVLLKYNLSQRHSSSCLATQRCAWTWHFVSCVTVWWGTYISISQTCSSAEPSDIFNIIVFIIIINLP